MDAEAVDYSELDAPQVLSILFYPRPDYGRPDRSGLDVMIPAADGVRISGRFHPAGPNAADILFFHGNGEIAADYDDMAPEFKQRGLSLLAVDYRGYGRSDGRPTVTGMMRDCRHIFAWVKAWRAEQGRGGPLVVMGRSLGSASALDLAAAYPAEIDGLIVESGFSDAGLLLALLGAPANAGRKFGQMEKMAAYRGPALVIHAEQDHLIPWEQGRSLYEASPSPEKAMLTVRGANHNDIHLRAFNEYMDAVSQLAQRAVRTDRPKE